ncbi:fatty-acid--AMP ligase [Gordonia otitidis]|uniref:fatty-acid--AMP ligase n=1 Tax=Gordonia otitidis TaxID=249058 RepID=UPI002ACDF780|nr:fatty-acid--AMP ligase [Gordonia otitidis]
MDVTTSVDLTGSHKPKLSDQTIPSLLRARATAHPDRTAFSFIDYDVDAAGYEESLTFGELYDRVRVVAAELLSHGAAGDRAAILAPQSLDYIVAFLGAMEAGFIVVPLSVPMFGAHHDERISSALADCTPSVIFATTAVVDDVLPYAQEMSGVTPAVVEVDALDYDSPVADYPDTVRRNRTAVLQYTSGSTSAPRGVMVSHQNVVTNLDQLITDMFAHHGGWPDPDTVLVSWLPFYHDMGLLLGICGGVLSGRRTVDMSPMAFLQKPSRWITTMASYGKTFTSAPNFAYELAARRTTDDDLGGRDLSQVTAFMCGAERVHASTIRRFVDRFERDRLPENIVRPAYGLAEATLYVAALTPGRTAEGVGFDFEKLASGWARRSAAGQDGSELMSHGPERSVTFRIVDPETCQENPADKVGEIWVHGDNVPAGYWRNPELTDKVFGGWIADPAPTTPSGPWLRTGDLGVLSEGDLFITGRIKDLLIIDGRNHYPDDIEGTVTELTRGRVAAVSVDRGAGEQLVVVAEIKDRGQPVDFGELRGQITSAVTNRHGVRVADIVFVAPGSIPITTSGKTRRSAAGDHYRDGAFVRSDSAQ